MNYHKTAIIVKDTRMFNKVVALLAKGGCNIDKIGPSRGLFVITAGPKAGRVDYLARNHPCVYTCVKKAIDKGYKILMGEDFIADPIKLSVWKEVVAKTVNINGTDVSVETAIAGLEALAEKLRRNQ